jgi:homoserine dehydrogenase
MKVVLIGFGTVGQGFVRILRDKATLLSHDYGLEVQIVGVATRTRGSLYRAVGLDPEALLTAVETGSLDFYPHANGVVYGMDTLSLIQSVEADVLIEATPTDFVTGLPALDHCFAALSGGMHLVLANKAPVALAYDQIHEQARRMGKRVLFESTVMAGTPSLRLARQALAGCEITEARGILNGTTNFILTQMESGMDYADALAEAQRLGYAEADPTADVDGWDAAGKAIILGAALFKKQLTFDNMTVEGISQITAEDVADAAAAGERWKLIAHVTPQGGSVQPTRIPITHPLASVSGSTNAVTYSTDLLGDVTLIGAGAGRMQTGFGILSDVLDIFRTENHVIL